MHAALGPDARVFSSAQDDDAGDIPPGEVGAREALLERQDQPVAEGQQSAHQEQADARSDQAATRPGASGPQQRRARDHHDEQQPGGLREEPEDLREIEEHGARHLMVSRWTEHPPADSSHPIAASRWPISAGCAAHGSQAASAAFGLCGDAVRRRPRRRWASRDRRGPMNDLAAASSFVSSGSFFSKSNSGATGLSSRFHSAAAEAEVQPAPLQIAAEQDLGGVGGGAHLHAGDAALDRELDQLQPVDEVEIEIAPLRVLHADLLGQHPVAADQEQLEAQQLLALPAQHQLRLVAHAVHDPREILGIELLEVAVVDLALLQRAVEQLGDAWPRGRRSRSGIRSRTFLALRILRRK